MSVHLDDKFKLSEKYFIQRLLFELGLKNWGKKALLHKYLELLVVVTLYQLKKCSFIYVWSELNYYKRACSLHSMIYLIVHVKDKFLDMYGKYICIC